MLPDVYLNITFCKSLVLSVFKEICSFWLACFVNSVMTQFFHHFLLLELL